MQNNISVRDIVNKYNVWKIKRNGLVIMTEKSISFKKLEDVQEILDTTVITIIEGTEYVTIVI